MYRPINRSLGIIPSVGPIPGRLLLPTIFSFMLVVFLNQAFSLKRSWIDQFFLGAFMSAGAWAFIGDRPWNNMGRLVQPPEFERRRAQYEVLLDEDN